MRIEIESAQSEQVQFPAANPFPGLDVSLPARSTTLWQVTVRGYGRNPELTQTVQIEASADASEDELRAVLARASREDIAGYRVGD